jgi:guanylate kinase
MLIESGLVGSVSVTTRLKRDGEIEGSDYFFISQETFETLVKQDKLFEYETFGDKNYGTLRDEFESKNVFIMTPRAISQMTPEQRSQCLIIMVYAPFIVRLKRAESRDKDFRGIMERFARDDSDFKDFMNYDIVFDSFSDDLHLFTNTIITKI